MGRPPGKSIDPLCDIKDMTPVACLGDQTLRDIAGDDGSDGRPQTSICRDCEGVKALGFLCSGSLGGTHSNCCAAVSRNLAWLRGVECAGSPEGLPGAAL